MARTYTSLDLIRFARFSKENEGLKPIDRLKAYNETYPELTAKQKWENIRKFLGNELADDIERSVAKTSKELAALPIFDVRRMLPVIKETALRCKIIFPTNENEEKMFEEGMEPKKCQKKYYTDLFKLLNELGNYA